MTLGDRIRTRREELRLSQEELAKKLGYKSRSTIAKLESGENDLTQSKVKAFAKALNTTPRWLLDYDDVETGSTHPAKGVQVSVLGNVAAGIPITAITYVEEYEEISQKLAKSGEFFALKIKGDSMLPRIADGDVVIVRQQSVVESGDVAVVLVNGDEATVKEVKRMDNGIMLIGWNTAVYSPTFYSNNDIKNLPITILGKVVECRCKF